MLQGMAALPTKDGAFVFYIGRVSTDQVAGFGTSAKHPISRAITAPYIKDMFKSIQSHVETRQACVHSGQTEQRDRGCWQSRCTYEHDRPR
jgi:hypothetical protein